MAQWMIIRKSGDFAEIGRENGISQMTARLLRNRDIITSEDIHNFLNPEISGLHDPELLKDITKASGIMKKEIEAGKKIRIIGDYDVDGVCSSYILLSGLKRCGAIVDVQLPHRIEDGYGLNISMVDKAYEDGVNTIITCDNGISAVDQVAHAKELGMTVIVTDHHEVLKKEENSEQMILPQADAVIDPKRVDDSYPFKEICGALVAYKFIQVLVKDMNIENDPDMKDVFRELRIFAGWATVCDVMPLKDENRIIVVDSMRSIPFSKNEGLNALLRECEIAPENVTCYVYGFVIGPCLNATGRLDTAMRGLDLLTENDPDVAARLAKELKMMNDERKEMTAEGQKEAEDKISEYEGKLPDVLVIYLSNLHESLAGIIAGRIRESTGRPTFVVTDSADGNIKGSGRSIEAYHMHDALSACRDLLMKFGGHKMAAGFTLKRENLDRFRDTLNENSTLTEKDFQEVLHLDMELPLKYLSIPVVREFEKLAPFGTANDEPLFAARNVELISGRIIGKNSNVGKISVRDENGTYYDMMVFQRLDGFMDFLEENFGNDNKEKLFSGGSHDKMNLKIAYRPNINEYRGTESLQLIMKDCMV